MRRYRIDLAEQNKESEKQFTIAQLFTSARQLRRFLSHAPRPSSWSETYLRIQPDTATNLDNDANYEQLINFILGVSKYFTTIDEKEPSLYKNFETPECPDLPLIVASLTTKLTSGLYLWASEDKSKSNHLEITSMYGKLQSIFQQRRTSEDATDLLTCVTQIHLQAQKAIPPTKTFVSTIDKIKHLLFQAHDREVKAFQPLVSEELPDIAIQEKLAQALSTIKDFLIPTPKYPEKLEIVPEKKGFFMFFRTNHDFEILNTDVSKENIGKLTRSNIIDFIKTASKVIHQTGYGKLHQCLKHHYGTDYIKHYKQLTTAIDSLSPPSQLGAYCFPTAKTTPNYLSKAYEHIGARLLSYLDDTAIIRGLFTRIKNTIVQTLTTNDPPEDIRAETRPTQKTQI